MGTNVPATVGIGVGLYDTTGLSVFMNSYATDSVCLIQPECGIHLAFKLHQFVATTIRRVEGLIDHDRSV